MRIKPTLNYQVGQTMPLTPVSKQDNCLATFYGRHLRVIA